MAPPASPNRPAGKRWTPPLCHEDLFVQRYQCLRRWALRLAGNLTDADDLLHDAFLQFVLRRRDLSQIENVDAYLYGMLRRLRLSKRRASLSAREERLAVIEYDTAELSLRATDPHEILRLHEQLREVCAYACARKETSKSGSVLLLRFFLGFFPGEIARILNCPLGGANDWLRIARREARAYLADPPPSPVDAPTGQPCRTNGGGNGNGHGNGGEAQDPLDELRARIRAARRGECLGMHEIAGFYGPRAAHTISCRLLAHVVSCADCLARVTAMLGMRDPSDRDPHDVLRQDTSWRFERHHGGGDDRPTAALLRRWERSLHTVREHAPRELRVTANGFPVGACRVRASDCAFTLAVNIDEPLDFVEVLSEQGVRLMLWAVEPAPAGDVDQSDFVELAGGRSLAAAVRFDRHWPSIEIAYRDPSWTADADRPEEPAAQAIPFRQARETRSTWARLRGLLGRRPLWPALRPAFAVLVLAAAVGVWARAPWRSEPVSAEQILADARSVEIRTASAPGLVVHRVLQLEERRLPDRAVRMRRRIEAWQSGRRGLVARRVYDERGRLVTGEWIRGDGTRTVYEPGQPPRVERAVGPPSMASSTIWQWEPTAATFEQLGGGAQGAAVRDEGTRYVLTWRADLAPGADGLVEATLVVAKDPLRPIAQTLVLRERGEVKEFHFAETARAELADASVPDAAFQPDTELLPSAAVRVPAAAAPSPRTPAARPVLDPVAAARLEVDLLFALHRLEACLDAPAEIAPDADDTLVVTASASSDDCRPRIRRAVDAAGGAVVTFAAARSTPPPEITAARAALDALPAYRTIMARFSAAGLALHGGAPGGDEPAVIAARAFGTWALEHSRRAHDEVRHLGRLTERWTPETLQPLDLDRLARWQDVVRDHARRFRRETAALRAQIVSLLPPAGAATPPDPEAADQAVGVRAVQDVRPAVQRLATMGATQDAAVRQLFEVASDAARAPIDLHALMESLRRAEAQAAWFDEPWTMPEQTITFGIEPSAHHIPVTTW